MHDGWIWIETLWNASGMSRLLDRHGEELLATGLVVLVALSLYRFVLQRARQHVDRNQGRALALRWRNALVAGVLVSCYWPGAATSRAWLCRWQRLVQP